MKTIAVIPCYNESKYLPVIIASSMFYLNDVVVADDDSTDDTIKVAKEYNGVVVKSDGTRGAGANTLRGIKKALELGADYIITLDGDGQHRPMELIRFISRAEIDKQDMIVGSRFLGDYDVPRYRKLGIDIITWLYNLGHKNKLSDSQSCFRLYSKELLSKDIITEAGFGFSVESLIKARAYGFNIKEIPISCIYHSDLRSNSTINPIKHGLMVVWAVIKWRVKIELPLFIKDITYKIFRALVKPLLGKGLGKIWLLRYIYTKFTAKMMPVKILNVHDFKVKIDAGKNGYDGMATELVMTNNYEPLTTSVFKRYLKKGMKVIDVGANLGYFSLLSSKIVGDTGKVWAFEPEMANYKRLIGNIELNQFKNINPIDKAVSDVSGSSYLFVSENESGEHSLISARPKIDNTQRVEVVRLDNYLDGEKIDLFKTDTEGNDIFVVTGAEEIIRRNDNIKLITEFWTQGLYAAGCSPEMYWGLLQDYGFKHIYIIDEIHKEILLGNCAKAINLCEGGKHSVNLLCSKRSLKEVLNG